MATIHISEILRILAERGEKDARPWEPGGFFIEVRFDDPAGRYGAKDDKYKSKVLTVETYLGLATIVFDDTGALRSIDIC